MAYLIHRTRVARQKVKLLSRRLIPDVHRLVRRPSRNHLPVRCPCALEQVLLPPVLQKYTRKESPKKFESQANFGRKKPLDRKSHLGAYSRCGLKRSERPWTTSLESSTISAHIKQKCDTVTYVLTLIPRNVFSRRFSLANGRTSHIITLLSMEFDKRWFPSGLSARPATRKAGYARQGKHGGGELPMRPVYPARQKASRAKYTTRPTSRGFH